MKYVGVDLHKQVISVCVVIQEDNKRKAFLVAADVELAQNEMRDHSRTAFDSLLDEMRKPPAMNGEG